VSDRIRCGVAGEVEETPKSDDLIFSTNYIKIVGSNLVALQAAKDRAKELGYNSLILSSTIEGETKEIAKMHTAIAREISESGEAVTGPACLISGGETTVTLNGNGKGGRNQEFVLTAVEQIAGFESTVVLSAGTDGTDGPTDAAGAICDGTSFERAKKMNLSVTSYLQENDSYNFFKKLNDLIITGPTNTNVMDLRLIMVG